MARCLNCGAENAEKQWAGIRVCSDCKRLADVLMGRNEKQVRDILLLCKEKIRATLLKGKLRVQDAEDDSSELRSDLHAKVRTLQEGSVEGHGPEPAPGTGHHALSRRG